MSSSSLARDESAAIRFHETQIKVAALTLAESRCHGGRREP